MEVVPIKLESSFSTALTVYPQINNTHQGTNAKEAIVDQQLEQGIF